MIPDDVNLRRKQESIGAEIRRRQTQEMTPLRADVRDGDDEAVREQLFKGERVVISLRRLQFAFGECDAEAAGKIPIDVDEA